MSLSIGIGGVSRAGKTTLSNYIKQLYPKKRSTIISMDDFVLEEEGIPRIKDRIDWETPASVNYTDIKNRIEESLVDYDLVVTEGILIFYAQEVNNLFHKRIFIDIPKSLFYIRRNSELRWGEEPKWYKDYVWDSYLKYGRLQESLTDTLYIRGNEAFSALMIDEYLFKVS